MNLKIKINEVEVTDIKNKKKKQFNLVFGIGERHYILLTDDKQEVKLYKNMVETMLKFVKTRKDLKYYTNTIDNIFEIWDLGLKDLEENNKKVEKK